MKKPTQIRNVLTGGLMTLIRNKSLSSEQVGGILRHVLFPGEFEINDGMLRTFAESFRPEYLHLCYKCAQTKLKELARLQKFYDSDKREKPAWFDDFYTKSHEYYFTISEVITNIIEYGNNDDEYLSKLTNAFDNVPIIKKSISDDTNRKRNKNRNKKSKSNIQSREERIYPPKSPEGIAGESDELPPAISPDDILGESDTDDVTDRALALSEAIEKTAAFSRMRTNRAKLMKCLVSLLKKNQAADLEREIIDALDAWTSSWEAEGWRYAPGRITDWLYDEKWKQLPREVPTSGGEIGEVGVAEIV